MIYVLLDMRDRQTGDLVSLDILDIDMALSISKGNDEKYYVNVNKNYRTDDVFTTETEAEDRLKLISSVRNRLESELREYE